MRACAGVGVQGRPSRAGHLAGPRARAVRAREKAGRRKGRAERATEWAVRSRPGAGENEKEGEARLVRFWGWAEKGRNRVFSNQILFQF